MLLQYWKRNKQISNSGVFAKRVFDNVKYDPKLVLEYLQNIFALKVGNKGIGEKVWERGEGGWSKKENVKGKIDSWPFCVQMFDAENLQFGFIQAWKLHLDPCPRL